MKDQPAATTESSQKAERFTPTVEAGLSSAQVEQRRLAGLTNAYRQNRTKSYGQIIKTNLITFFNMLNAVLAALIILTGHYKELSFLIVILGNLAIGLIQEINAKRTLDKLSLMVAAKVNVRRDGKQQEVSAAEVVLDDIFHAKIGDQLCADGTLLEGYLEVNESLISGEADNIVKRPGDYLYSGSIAVSGSGWAQAERVGEESFVNTISTGAKVSKQRPSEIKTSINSILRTVSFIVVPVGILMFLRQWALHMPAADNIVKTVGAVIGMIPEGLFLLTSMSLAASAVILAYKKTLVQDLYGVETLAHVDVLCLDKTGTLTEGYMQVEQLIPVDKTRDAHKILANLCTALSDENATINAIREYAGCAKDFSFVREIPFSSDRKYSGAVFREEGTYFLGAFDFVFSGHEEDFRGLKKIVDAYSDQGSRVLVLAYNAAAPKENEIPEGTLPVSLILISDRIRKEAPEALRYFYEQDVQIKVISGDNPKTVAYIAKRAGVKDADHCIDAAELTTDEQLLDAVRKYNVFGRVTPAQKKKMILFLKMEGHTVAMTGDGVNDVLALKEADCSIAMASGSSAAKNISTLVLLDSDFSHMPSVVAEGRKVINNLQRVATLFITKTIYAILLAISSLLLLSDGYPFSPIQLTLISFITIGFPAFFLALEPNNTRIKGSFMLDVFAKSLPGGLCVILSILVVNLLSGIFGYSAETVTTMCIVLATAAGLWIVAKVSSPFTLLRKIILGATIGIFVLGFTLMGWFFDISPLAPQQWVILAIIVIIMPYFMRFLEWAIKKIAGAYMKKFSNRKTKLPFVGFDLEDFFRDVEKK